MAILSNTKTIEELKHAIREGMANCNSSIMYQTVGRELFQWSCLTGKNALAQWIHATFPAIDIHAGDSTAFQLACRSPSLELVQWIWSQKPSISETAHLKGFQNACSMGNLRTAKWLHALTPVPASSSDVLDAFWNACAATNVEMVHWMLDEIVGLLECVVKPDVGHEYLEALSWVCKHGDVELMEFMLKTKPNALAATIPNDLPVARFILQAPVPPVFWACLYRQYHIVEWLIEHNYISRDLQEMKNVVIELCKRQQMDVAMWVYKTFDVIAPCIKEVCAGLNNDENALVEWINEAVTRSKPACHFNSWFTEACADNRMHVVKGMLDANPSFTIRYVNSPEDGANAGAVASNTTDVLGSICYKGHFELLVYLAERFADTVDLAAHGHSLFVFVVLGGHFHIADWLHERAPVRSASVIEHTFILLARSVKVDSMQWLIDHHASTFANSALSEDSLMDVTFKDVCRASMNPEQYPSNVMLQTVTEEELRKQFGTVARMFTLLNPSLYSVETVMLLDGTEKVTRWNVVMPERTPLAPLHIHMNTFKMVDIETIDEDARTCPICYTNRVSLMAVTCEHSYCQECISECFRMRRDSCALCRTKLSAFYQII